MFDVERIDCTYNIHKEVFNDFKVYKQGIVVGIDTTYMQLSKNLKRNTEIITDNNIYTNKGNKRLMVI